MDDSANLEAALSILFHRAESYAIEVNDWYMRDKRLKRRVSQTLRAAAILFAAAGGLVPLLQVAHPGLLDPAWGYVLLAIAATCVAFDRLFGLSKSWMRDIFGALAVQRCLAQFQLDWATYSAAPVTSTAFQERATAIKLFIQGVHDIVASETKQWEAEFQSALEDLRQELATPHRST